MTIEECKRAFTESLGSGNKAQVFMPSPTVTAAVFADEEFGKELAQDVKSKITFDGAAEMILAADFASAANDARAAVVRFLDHANKFTNIHNLNVFAVGDAESFDESFDQFREEAKTMWSGAQVYAICLIDEMTPGGKESAAAAMARLEKHLGDSRVFVLGRTKQNGRIAGKDAAREAQRKIIRDIILNAEKLNLSCGAYSAGRASIEDCAGEFWTEALNACKITADGAVQSQNINTIEQMINDAIGRGYKNEFSVADLAMVMRNNESVSFGNGKDKECVKKLYGDALEVYLEHERRKAREGAEKAADEVKRIVAAADEKTKLILQNNIRQRLNAQGANTNNGAGMANFLGAVNVNVVKETYERYLYGKIQEVKAEYMNKALNAVLNVVAEGAIAAAQAAERFDKQRQNVDAYVKNCMMTTHNLGGNIPQIVLKMPSVDYIDGVCGGLSAALAGGGYFESYIAGAPQAAAAWMIAEADPYCINNSFNVRKKYYMAGKGDAAQKIRKVDNTFTPIDAGYDEYDFALNVSNIDLAVYRNFVTRN